LGDGGDGGDGGGYRVFIESAIATKVLSLGGFNHGDDSFLGIGDNVDLLLTHFRLIRFMGRGRMWKMTLKFRG
jgi:hypothetical protein